METPKNEVVKTTIQPKYENSIQNKHVSSKQVLFEYEIYDSATEYQTSKDDSELSNLIQLVKSNTSDTNPVFKNTRFLQLIFKLFCRQPSLNESIVNSTYQSLLNEPYFTCGVRNISNILPNRNFKKWVNSHCLQPTQYDISLDYSKVKFTFCINQTNTPFILPDNTTRLVLPLSPSILVKLDFNCNKPLVQLGYITDPDVITQINTILIKNCTSYYISQQLADK